MIKMPLTPEQHEQVREAKARGARRVTVTFTAEQRKAWKQTVEEEQVGKVENLAMFRKIVAAAEQPGFFGDLRRAILLSRRSPAELSAAIGVDDQQLSGFRAGAGDLPAASMDRLIETLGLRLVQEIPH
jgi:hypothetical protein